MDLGGVGGTGGPPAGPVGGAAAREGQAGTKTGLRVEWLSGVAAKDWDSVAKKDHLSELSAALMELESELQSVYRQMLDMRSRVRSSAALAESCV